jgi:hypothetical protein
MMVTLLPPPIWTIGSWSANVVDANGVMWVSPSSTGWFDPPGVRGSDVDMPSADGNYSTPTHRTERVITIPGYCKAPTIALRDAAADQFTGLLAGGVLAPLSVQENSRTLTATVKLGNGCNLDPTSPYGFEWQLVLIAPDPRKYDNSLPPVSTSLAIAQSGLDWSTGGGLDWTGGSTGGLVWGAGGSDGTCTILNNGNTAASPVFTVAGPTDIGTLSNISITNSATGQVIAYGGVLLLNDVLVIDSRAASRNATLNSQTDVWSNLATSQWFSVPAHGLLKIQFQGISASTTPLLTVASANTYI